MATDLREEQRASTQAAATRRRRDKRDLRWPYVATAIVLVVLAAVTVLVIARDPSRTPASSEVWRSNVEGMMTDVREGSGYAPAVASEPITYANGAFTGDREGSGFLTYVPTVTAHFPGHSFYAEGASTEIREGAGFESNLPPRIGRLPGHGAYGAPTTDGRCP